MYPQSVKVKGRNPQALAEPRNSDQMREGFSMSMNLRGLFVVFACLVLVGTSSCDTQLLQDIVAPSPLPEFSWAKSRSNHYVDLQLASPAGAEAKVAANYKILSADGGSLSVLAAELSEDGRAVRG